MVGIEKPGMRVLEIASGLGTHAEIAAMSLLSKEGKLVLVTCDYSEAMVKLVAERFSASDFVQIPGYIAEIDSKTDYATNG